MKTLWFDFLNTPHVQFLKPFIRKFGAEHPPILSCRDFAETRDLAENLLGQKPFVVGTHAGANRLFKAVSLAHRFLSLQMKIPHFEVVFGCGNTEAAALARLRGKAALNFDDNDQSPNWMYAPFTTMAFFPKVIPRDKLLRQGFRNRKLYQYDGYKEDIYIADFEPDRNFLSTLPFTDYWLVRGENVQASYVGARPATIVPELLKRLDRRGVNVVFLPRYKSDGGLEKRLKRVFIPEEPVDGLNAVYYSLGVMTGAGTLAREAACMGKPAVSFYAGKTLLAVERQLIEEKAVYHSRDPKQIVDYSFSATTKDVDPNRSRAVQSEVFNKVAEVLAEKE